MSTFRNADGDVLDVPDELAAFVVGLGYARLDDKTFEDAPAAPAPPIPAAPTPDPSAGDNDSEGVTNNG